jgi:hypothetical protein
MRSDDEKEDGASWRSSKMHIKNGMCWILEERPQITNDCFSISTCAKNLFTGADFHQRPAGAFKTVPATA